MTRNLLLLVALLAACAHSITLSTSPNSASFASAFGLDAKFGTEDVFVRPTVGVLIVVDGEGPIAENEWTPFFKTLSKHESKASSLKEIFETEKLNKFRSFAKQGLAVGSSSLPDDSEEVQTYWKLVGNDQVQPFMHQDGHAFWRNNIVVIEQDSRRLEAELALVEQLTGNMLKSDMYRPGVVIGVVHGLKDRHSNQRSESMHQLSKTVESLARKLRSGSSRPLVTVVFTERKQGPSSSSVSEQQVFAEQSRRQLQSTKRTPFQGGDYVIMFWTIVAFIFLTFFVILCIPWAPALDPALRSTLKPDAKRD